MKKPSFTINRTSRLTTIRLDGEWNSAIDLEYLAELASTMQQMRKGTWAIVVDIRSWYIDPDTAKQNTNYSLHLDRRNQLAEVWIVREHNQAKHLDVFFDPLNFTPARVTSRQELEQWATDNHIELPEDLY